jgi:hypothetical protein
VLQGVARLELRRPYLRLKELTNDFESGWRMTSIIRALGDIPVPAIPNAASLHDPLDRQRLRDNDTVIEPVCRPGEAPL